MAVRLTCIAPRRVPPKSRVANGPSDGITSNASASPRQSRGGSRLRDRDRTLSEARMTARALSDIRPVPRRGLSRVEAAIYLGCSPSKFDDLRKDGRVGPARLIDGRKVWDVRELDLVFEALPLESDDAAEDWNVAV
jgi:hypothetical protein